MSQKFFSDVVLSTLTTGSMLKLDSNGKIVEAVDGTDYISTSASSIWSNTNGGIYYSDNVRIGTYQSAVAPAAKLHVFDYQTTTPKLLIEDGNTGDASMEFKISTQSYVMGIDNSDSDKFVLAASTALGTTNVLEVSTGGAVAFQNDVLLKGNTYANGGVIIDAPAPTLVLRDSTDDDDHYIQFKNNGDTLYYQIDSVGDTWNFNSLFARSIKFGTAGSDRLVITGGGNVGIGTTAPAEKLHVVGNIISKSSGDTSYIAHSGSSDVYLAIAGRVSDYPNPSDNAGSIILTKGTTGEAYPFNSYGHMVISARHNAATDILFRTNGTLRAVIDGSGNVGIGNSSPSQKLDVTGVIQGFGSIRVNSQSTGSPYFGLYQNGVEKAYLQYVDGTTDNLVVQSDGKVTIRGDVQYDQGDTDGVISFNVSTNELAKIDQDGYMYAAGFKTTTAATGFLKANGTVDTNTYASSTHNHNTQYVAISGGYYDSDFTWDGTHDFQNVIKLSGASATTTNKTALFYGTGGLVEKRALGTAAFSATGDFAAASHTHTLLTALGDYVWNASTNPRDFPAGIQTSFVKAADGYPEYGSVMRIKTYNNDGGAGELYFPYSNQYGGDTIKYRLGLYNNAGFSGWYNIASREWVVGQNYLTSVPSNYATTSYVTTAISNLVDSAPATLDTLNELAAALGDDPNFATTVTNSIATKVSKGGDTMTGNLKISIPDNGSAPSTTAILKLEGYEGRGAGIKIQDSKNSASGASNREWFVGTGYSQSGFNIGYSATGSQSDYSAQRLFYINTAGDVTITGGITASGYNKSNWDTAYSWGNHADENYLTSYTETDTLASVAARGNVSNTALAVEDNDASDHWAFRVNTNGSNNSGFWTTDEDVRLLLRNNSGSIKVDLRPDGTSYFYNALQASSTFTASGTATFNGVVNLNSGVNFDGVNGQNFTVNTDEQRIIWDFQRNGTRRMSFYHEADQETFNFSFQTGANLQINGNRILTTADSSSFAAASHTHSYLPLSGGTLTGNLVMQDETIDFKSGGSSTLPQFLGHRSATDLNSRAWSSEGGWAYTTFESSSLNTPSTTSNNANGLLSFNTHSGAYGHQIAMTNNGGLHHRFRQNGAFSGWTRIATESFASAEAQAVQDNLDNLAGGLGSLALENTVSISEVVGLQTALNGKLSTTGKAADSNLLDGLDSSVFMRKSADSNLAMNNYNITGVNHITINDSGFGEGVQWQNWLVCDSPDNLSNAAGNFQITSTLDNSIRVTVDTNGNFYPSRDRRHLLGKETNRWQIVFCEILDSAGQHEKNLQNPEGEKSVGEYETGTVLVWKGGKNVPCTEAADHMRMGIAVKGIDSPLIQGAEPVLVTGSVKEGDYLVTSRKEGHAEAISPQFMRQHGLYDCVLGKALESAEGESHLVKTWINI
jgi:hypothetical protein